MAPLIRPRAWVAVIAGAVLSLFLAAPPLRSQAGPTLVAQVPHLGRIHAMAYSPDGRTLATAGSDRTVKLWEADRGLLIRTLEGHAGAVRSAVFSADGTRLLSASDDGTVRVWDVTTGRTATTLSGDRQGAMSGAAFGEGDTVIAAQTAEFAPGTPRTTQRVGRVESCLRHASQARADQRVLLGSGVHGGIDRWRSVRTVNCGRSQR